MRIAMTYTRLRTEERLLLDEFEALGLDIEGIDLRKQTFDPQQMCRWKRFDIVLDRAVSLTNSLTSTRILEAAGVRCVNPLSTLTLCCDKLATSVALASAGVPVPRFCVATTPESGIEAVEQIGYPCVLKPAVGSWGRLLARVNDRDAAESLLEHRHTLGSPQQSVVYAQEHIDKPGRDLRVFVIGGEPVAAIARYSDHWVTNTALGATTQNVELHDELCEISLRAAEVVGGDAVAVDLLECPDRGLLVNEINHSMEFRNSIEVTGVNIPRLVAEHVSRIAAGELV